MDEVHLEHALRADAIVSLILLAWVFEGECLMKVPALFDLTGRVAVGPVVMAELAVALRSDWRRPGLPSPCSDETKRGTSGCFRN